MYSQTVIMWFLAGHIALVCSGAVSIFSENFNSHQQQSPNLPIESSNLGLTYEKVFIHQEDLTQPTNLFPTGQAALQHSESNSTIAENCTEPSIKDFPELMSTYALNHGGVVIPMIVSAYIFYAIAYLCETFFVPSVDSVCRVLKVPSDVAGATFMAIATSSPEFFTNVIGTFVTNGDIGVGSVIGSVVFNLLVIVAWCGLLTKDRLKLDWWPLTRDCGFYVLSVFLLIGALWDGRIYWYEALVLILAYLGYLFVICKNKSIQSFFTKKWKTPKKGRFCDLIICGLSNNNIKDKNCNETSPLLGDSSKRYVAKMTTEPSSETLQPLQVNSTDTRLNLSCTLKKNNSYSNLMRSLPPLILLCPKDGQQSCIVTLNEKINCDANPVELSEKTTPEMDEIHHTAHETLDFFHLPKGKSWLKWFEWIVGWPVRFILHITIPDCRTQYFQWGYPITFLFCIVYMAIFSYLITWMMTIIGQIVGIPDAIMGLTLIAGGTSLPEAISSIIVAKKGLGTMSISNSVGSNTFNILFCLGVPWFIKNQFLIASSAGTGESSFIPMVAGGFNYVSIFLIASAFLIYVLIALNDFYLDFKIGIVALLVYVLFVTLASMLELNVFFFVNLPTCTLVN